jgi:glutamyl-tRNA synthetase
MIRARRAAVKPTQPAIEPRSKRPFGRARPVGAPAGRPPHGQLSEKPPAWGCLVSNNRRYRSRALRAPCFWTGKAPRYTLRAMTQVVVRFAPSPTGFLHLGSARTALYNWLWARRHGGRFILRIEDTDRERSTDAAVQVIFDSLRWLGLDWDEGPGAEGELGPYFQMERLVQYRQYADKLIAAGAAYRCYCSAEDLAKARAEHKARSGSEQGFRYPGTCRERNDQPDAPHVIRIKMPREGAIGWDDLVKGRLEFPADSQQDAVLMRQNGIPLYNLGAAVDDLTMGITLVARGEDHVINTPQQILIYRALGEPLPQFAHMPLILGPSGEKLSKRHASVAVLDYRDQGYLPDAMLNYLVRLGWSHGDQEIFTRQELIEKFDWAQVGRTGGRWDAKKFSHVQASHLRGLDPARVAELVVPFMAARGLEVAKDDPRLRAAAELIMPRATTLVEAAEALDYFFREIPVMDPVAVSKLLTPQRAELLAALSAQLETVEVFDRATLEQKLKSWTEGQGMALQDMAQPARVALTGRKASPGLFEVMEVLGKQRTLDRLRSGAELARARA